MMYKTENGAILEPGEWEHQSQIEELRRRNEEVLHRTGMPPLAYVHTFGCQQNVSDSEKIKGLLRLMGYAFTDDTAQADFILFNTCAVRENAESRVFGNVGELKKLKRENPQLIIALCGCMMQQERIVQKIKKSYPYVDIVFGTQAIQTLPGLMLQVLDTHRRVYDTRMHAGQIVENLPVWRQGGVKAWVPIMYGCDNFCTYCIVPYVRGREVSRQPQAILQEIQGLVEQGYREITLLGQNVNSYGKGLTPAIDFPGLLQLIDELPGDFWVRFMTSHPKDCTPRLIDTIANSKKLCRHLHLPVQCGSNRVLRDMNRRYTREEYLSLVGYARRAMPDLALTSDIIVGFPGESYEEFSETLDLIKQVQYESLYTFIYSPRPSTKAAQMPDPVDAKEKSRWFRELLELQDAIGYERYKVWEGTTQTVLLDGESAAKPGILTGRTQQNLLVEVPAPAQLVGSFVPVKLQKAVKWALQGVLAQEKEG